jgi:N-acetylglutamate synthase-like GNAT family acetyltransferase
MSDQTLQCKERDCGQEFVFTEGEQKFFADKGFTPPSRCKMCRQKRKAEKEAKESQDY